MRLSSVVVAVVFLFSSVVFAQHSSGGVGGSSGGGSSGGSSGGGSHGSSGGVSSGGSSSHAGSSGGSSRGGSSHSAGSHSSPASGSSSAHTSARNSGSGSHDSSAAAAGSRAKASSHSAATKTAQPEKRSFFSFLRHPFHRSEPKPTESDLRAPVARAKVARSLRPNPQSRRLRSSIAICDAPSAKAKRALVLPEKFRERTGDASPRPRITPGARRGNPGTEERARLPLINVL